VLQKKKISSAGEEERNLEGETAREQEIEAVLIGHERNDRGHVKGKDQGKNRREEERDSGRT